MSAFVTKYRIHMAETMNDRNQDDAALDGLPEKERTETKQILDELGKEAPDPSKPDGKDSKDKPADDKKPAEQKPEDKKPDGESKETGDKKPVEGRRDVKLIPAWLHERAKADWEKKEKDLLASIEAAKTAISTDKDGQKRLDIDEKDLDKEVEALVEEHGIDAKLAKSLILAGAKRASTIPPEIAQELAALKQAREAAIITAEVAQFNADFDKNIVPLIKAEYGQEVPAETIEKVREDLKAKAYTPEYQKIPYSVIYKGTDDFRGIIAPIKAGAESSRGGTTTAAIDNGGDAIDLTKPVPDEVLKSLSDKDFEIYQKNMESFEKSSKK